ncbi:MAG: ATP-binding cassette domain-containing protein [Micrococcales bacterium]
MIKLTDTSFTFTNAESPALRRLNLEYGSGEFALVAGPTGSGKSTLLKMLIGLAPHFTGGRITGSIQIDGLEFAGAQPHDFASRVGYVNQQPEGSFVSDTVREELAFGMEQLGIAPDAMVARINFVAATMNLGHLLDANLESLSGGEQQRVAIAAAIAGGQQILILDEPTSALDTASASALIAVLRKLSSQGITVTMAEHRIERILGLVDSITVVHGDGTASKVKASSGFDQLLRNNRMVPPVVELGQKLGWQPLALSVAQATERWRENPGSVVPRPHIPAGPVLLSATDLGVSYGNLQAVSEANLEVRSGNIAALVGPNGSGKSSILWSLAGEQRHTGTVSFSDGTAPASLKPAERLARLAMVPQNASDLLMLSSVGAELADSDSFAHESPGTTGGIFAQLAGRIDPKRHPRDLSSGQQLALVISMQLAKGAGVLLLDEPTRGLDYLAKARLAEQLAALREAGKAILIASHDVEFLALVADTCTLISGGRLAETGDAQTVLATLAEHAPQVWQVTHRVSTVAEVSA